VKHGAHFLVSRDVASRVAGMRLKAWLSVPLLIVGVIERATADGGAL
jgi:hypothetical protein